MTIHKDENGRVVVEVLLGEGVGHITRRLLGMEFGYLWPALVEANVPEGPAGFFFKRNENGSFYLERGWLLFVPESWFSKIAGASSSPPTPGARINFGPPEPSAPEQSYQDWCREQTARPTNGADRAALAVRREFLDAEARREALRAALGRAEAARLEQSELRPDIKRIIQNNSRYGRRGA